MAIWHSANQNEEQALATPAIAGVLARCMGKAGDDEGWVRHSVIQNKSGKRASEALTLLQVFVFGNESGVF